MGNSGSGSLCGVAWNGLCISDCIVILGLSALDAHYNESTHSHAPV